MGDMGDTFRAWDEMKKAKKESNKESSTAILEREGIRFASKNGGYHLIITDIDTIDFYPSTGKWLVRNGGKGRGIKSLLRHIKAKRK